MLTPTPLTGGLHPNTALLSHLLAGQGIVNPATSQPFSEALLLGIGGGLGMGYILWEFKPREPAHAGLRILTLGFTHRWNYATEAYDRTLSRLGLTAEVYETGGHVTAERHLEELLAAGRAAIAWVDLAHLPQHGLPGELDGCLGQVVGVVGLDETQAYLDERGEHALPISREALAAARGRIGSFKHRLLAVSGAATGDLRVAIIAGLRDHVVHLGRASDSFSLPAIRKWARLIVDERHAKGWRRVFADRRSLYSALLGAYEGAQPSVSGGGALRGLYADFIDEAATLLAMPALATAAPPYRAAEEAWRRFAQACLPGFVAPFGQARRLLARREALLLHGAHTPSELAELGEVNTALAALRAELDAAWPLDNARTHGLFDELAARLEDIYAREMAALATLQEAAQPVLG